MNNYWCDLGSIPVWKNQIQCFRIRDHYRYQKGTQNTVNVSDASNYSTKYDSKTESTCTTNKYNECECIPINNHYAYRPKTWESVISLYGDADTTEVWDDNAEAPIPTIKSNQLKKRPEAFEKVTATKKSIFSISKEKDRKLKLNRRLLKSPKKSSMNLVPKVDDKHENVDEFDVVDSTASKTNYENKNIDNFYYKKTLSNQKTYNNLKKDSEKQKKTNLYCQFKTEKKKLKKPKFHIFQDRNRHQSGDFCTPSTCVEIFEQLYESKIANNTLCSCKNRKINVDAEDTDIRNGFLKTEVNDKKQNNVSKLKKSKALCECTDLSNEYENKQSNRTNEESLTKKKNMNECKTRKHPNVVTTNKQKDNGKQKKNESLCACKLTDLTKKNENQQTTITFQENDTKEKNKHNLCECHTQNYLNKVATDKQKCNRKHSYNKSPRQCKFTDLIKVIGDKEKFETIQESEYKKKYKNNLCECITQKCLGNINVSDITENHNENKIVPDIRNVKEDKLLCKCKIVHPKNGTNRKTFRKNEYNVFQKIFFARRNAKNRKKKNEEKVNEPLFEIKVDTTDMHVINPTEIKHKFKHLDSTKNVSSCVCMSRQNRIKSQSCKAGVCRKARKQKNKQFICKCENETKKVECNDISCNQTDIFRKHAPAKLSHNIPEATKKLNPLFDVILDKTNMNIVNSDEIVDIFNNASLDQCKRGVCRIAARKNIESNCKCIGKKIPKSVRECSNETCNDSIFRSRLCNFCSNIFSKSDGWNSTSQYLKNQKRDVSRISTRLNTIHKRRNVEKAGKKINIERKKKLREKCRKCIAKLMSAKEREKIQRDQELAHMTQDERVQFYIQENRQSCDEKIKEKEEIYKKKDKEAEKKLEKRIEKLLEERHKDGHHSTFLNDIIAGPFNVIIRSMKQILISTYYVIVDPLGSYVYVRAKLKHPVQTIDRLRKWLIRTWHSKTVFLSSIVKNSRILNILSDQIEDHPLFEKIIASRISAKELARFERKAVMRKKRIQMRRDEALFGCRHIMLTTLRKTPCLWIYTICPNLYPQCLSLMAFFKNFINIIIFLIALACWTPCILAVELCRALLCCVVCTN